MSNLELKQVAYAEHTRLVNEAFDQQKLLSSMFRGLTHQETWEDTLQEIGLFQKELTYWANIIESIQYAEERVKRLEACKDADQ